MGESTATTRARFWLYARPAFRTFDLVCNHTARFLERDRGLSHRDLRAEIAELNERRMRLAHDLARVSGRHGHVCASCKGWCCGSERYRDAFIDRILQDPETSNRIPRSRRKVTREAEHAPLPLRGLAREVEFLPDYCPNCTADGCRMSFEHRPMQCLAYFCRRSIATLSAEECETAIDALAGLMRIQARTVALAASSRFLNRGAEPRERPLA